MIYGIRVIGRHSFPRFEQEFQSKQDRALYLIKIAPVLISGDKVEFYEKEA